ncbi:hypothetical protein EV426DRAFT_703785 [Tirmania nivea]|nr:hypothetical protein EV426DRAFT_703785 [Tirmania nivea]
MAVSTSEAWQCRHRRHGSDDIEAWQSRHKRHGSVDIGGMAMVTAEAWQWRQRRHGSVDSGGTTILLPMRTELAGLPGHRRVAWTIL